ncbi:MAG TPA: hypothetical protein VMR37_02990, partial [Rhabdochlamydiaceae bacterium]|nr:hypothetical protein [Rhabdochlamydiaceae bacterium]
GDNNTGIAAAAQDVGTAFTEKNYELKLANGMSTMTYAQLLQMAQYFAALPAAELAKLKPLLEKAFSAYQVTMPAGGKQTVLQMVTTVNGKQVTAPATLFDLICPPAGATFTLTFKANIDDGHGFPSLGSFGSDFDNSYSTWDDAKSCCHSQSGNFNINGTNGMTCHFYNSACGTDATFTASGSAAQWLSAAGSQLTTSANPTGDANGGKDLANYLIYNT